MGKKVLAGLILTQFWFAFESYISDELNLLKEKKNNNNKGVIALEEFSHFP